jgi:hypothetical protein
MIGIPLSTDFVYCRMFDDELPILDNLLVERRVLAGHGGASAGLKVLIEFPRFMNAWSRLWYTVTCNISRSEANEDIGTSQ